MTSYRMASYRMASYRTLAAASGTLALTLTLALGACGGTAETDTAPTPAAEQTGATDPVTFNEADTEFAQMMTIHHEGALEMAAFAAEEASAEEVRALAERIEAAQQPEIDLKTSWLQRWDQEMPDEAEHGAMDHGGMDMGGLSQQEAMEELRGLSGTDLHRRFLELMIEHHRGAVEMAEMQREDGENPEAVELAGRIIDDQQTEITEMERLLAEL